MIATAALYIAAAVENHGRPTEECDALPLIGIFVTMAFDYLMLSTAVGACP